VEAAGGLGSRRRPSQRPHDLTGVPPSPTASSSCAPPSSSVRPCLGPS
jgi:hypothetical protein